VLVQSIHQSARTGKTRLWDLHGPWSRKLERKICMVTLTPGSIGQCPVANLFFRRLHARVGRTLAMPKSPAFCTKSFSPTAVRPRRKKERTHSSCSRVERLCGPERDGRKGAHAQSSCVLTLSLVVWDGSTHTCAVQRDASAIFLSRRFGRPCGPLLHLFVRLWRDFGLLDRSLVCIFN
jgi:hypothetical protein